MAEGEEAEGEVTEGEEVEGEGEMVDVVVAFSDRPRMFAGVTRKEHPSAHLPGRA